TIGFVLIGPILELAEFACHSWHVVVPSGFKATLRVYTPSLSLMLRKVSSYANGIPFKLGLACLLPRKNYLEGANRWGLNRTKGQKILVTVRQNRVWAKKTQEEKLSRGLAEPETPWEKVLIPRGSI
ncbi:MAG: hypothetical protein ACE5R6_22090, partial [Candidatus Heimdallarchaeota archaeon]